MDTTQPTLRPAMMTNSVLTSVLVLLAGLSLVVAASQTDREARSVIVSESLQVMKLASCHQLEQRGFKLEYFAGIHRQSYGVCRLVHSHCHLQD